MKSLKDYIMGNEKKKHLAERKVTTISYDLDTTKDNNINQEIKDYLIAKGWNYIVPEQQVVRYVGKTTVEKNVDTPNTTAWKADMNPIDAINEFSAAIEAYNGNHMFDKPAKFGRGKAFAVCDNEYESLRIE